MSSGLLVLLVLQAMRSAPPDATVRLAVAGGGGIAGGSVSVAVRLGCSCSSPSSGFLVNTNVEGVHREQPSTVLTLTLVDASGREVAPGPETGKVDRALWRPVDLLLLRCGAQYGWIVPLRLDWHRVLTAGKYRVRARLENHVGGYFQSHPAERARLLKAMELTPDEAAPVLQDFTVVADEATIEVVEK